MGKSAYNFFSDEKRKELKESNPDMKFGEVSKKIGAMWKELSEEDKKPYQEMADKAKAEAPPKEKKTKKGGCKNKKNKKEKKSSDDEEEGSDDE